MQHIGYSFTTVWKAPCLTELSFNVLHTPHCYLPELCILEPCFRFTRQKRLFAQLNFDGIYHFANALKGKAKL